MAAIDAQSLIKHYGGFAALRGVDLLVPDGALFGLVGPNGSGKSTLIKALVGSMRPTGGRVRTLGLDPLRERAALRRQIGYMPQAPALYNDLSARDNIRFFGSAHAVPDLQGRIDEVLAFTDLHDRQHDPVGRFSGGMQRRASLACALVHRPRMLFLDEPTAAVDPALRARLWELFRRLAAEGTTLFISTHLMDEALLCDRVAILREGRVIADETPRALLERGHIRLTLSLPDGEQTVTVGGYPEDLARALRRYGLNAGVRAVRVEADSLESVLLALIARQPADE